MMAPPFPVSISVDILTHLLGAWTESRFNSPGCFLVLGVRKISVYSLLDSDIVEFGSNTTVYSGKIGISIGAKVYDLVVSCDAFQ